MSGASLYDLRGEPGPRQLIDLLEGLDRAAVAYSGGVDSALLLKAAHDVLGERCIALTAVSPAFPEEPDTLCQTEGIHRVIFQADLLGLEGFRNNGPDRCYHCKRWLFSQMGTLAGALGFPTVLEGSNRDDLGDYRPGRRALQELGVKSPLLQCGLGKAEVRRMAKALDLAVWDRPAAACLASRIPYGEAITARKLERIGAGEALLHSMGFARCRVRSHGEIARLEVPLEDFAPLLERREALTEHLRRLGWTYVTLDLMGLRTGSMNERLRGAGDGTA